MADRVTSSPVRPVLVVDPAPQAAPAAAPEQTRAEVPFAPRSSPAPRSHSTTPSSDKSTSVNAVILGLAAVPAALVAFIPSSADAQANLSLTHAPGTGVSTESLARAELFAARSEDPRVTELVQKINTLVTNNHGGNARAAFDAYAGADGQVSRSELSTLLSDAGIGNFVTRGAWVSGIMERVDTNGSNSISWSEFQAVMRSGGPANA